MDGFGFPGRHEIGRQRSAIPGTRAQSATWWLQQVELVDGMLLLLASATATFGVLALMTGAKLIPGGL